jgi:hypothetical protein
VNSCPGGPRPAAELAGRVYVVLTTDRVDDLRDRDIELGQLIRFYPNPHRILPGTEDLHLRYARHAAEGVAEVDVGVIGQKLRVARTRRRAESDDHERSRERFLDGDSEVADGGGQLRFRLGVTQLGQHVVDVGVGREIEVDEHAHRAVVGVDRIHVVHVVHAAHLLFDGRGHGLLNRLRVGAHVIRLNVNLGWNDLGELRHRQPQQRHQAHDDHDDRNHHGDNRTVDEEFRHASYLPVGAAAV